MWRCGSIAGPARQATSDDQNHAVKHAGDLVWLESAGEIDFIAYPETNTALADLSPFSSRGSRVARSRSKVLRPANY
ncbi:hypothetical protein CH254_04520 [Rhodococcus sp. 06-412-2C]|nr:hypothetical protein CH254_04520 [Rhodococcus sp. 06-412-2C]OZC92316.1 hypothetical protein CH279_25795 [Rhodococcus sp. 06-412-2B]